MMRASRFFQFFIAVAALGCSADSAVTPPVTPPVTPAEKFDPIQVQGDFIIEPDTSLLVVGGGRRLGIEDPGLTYRLSFGRADWSSSNESIATVDGAGYVHALGEGMTTITAVIDGHRASAPVFVQRYPAPLRFSQTSVGFDYACGLTDGGAIYCWGNGDSGQLGTTQPTDSCERFYGGGPRSGLQRVTSRCSAVPVRVESDEHFVSVEAQDFGTCGLTAAGAIFCWGTVPGGQFLKWPVPQRTGGSRVYAAISPPCAITTDGDAYCWGRNSLGRLGIGTASSIIVSPDDPVLVSGGLKWKSISSNAVSSCGISTDGVTWCWGSNYSGELGIGADTTAPSGCYSACRPAPTRVLGSQTFKQLSMGTTHACALTGSGEMFCWGRYGYDSGERRYNVPTSMGSTRYLNLASGYEETCAVSLYFRTICFGAGVPFLKFVPRSAQPVEIPLPQPMRIVGRTEVYGACGIGTNGKLYCWSNESIMLGAGELRQTGYGPVGAFTDTTAVQFSEVAGQR